MRGRERVVCRVERGPGQSAGWSGGGACRMAAVRARGDGFPATRRLAQDRMRRRARRVRVVARSAQTSGAGRVGGARAGAGSGRRVGAACGRAGPRSTTNAAGDPVGAPVPAGAMRCPARVRAPRGRRRAAAAAWRLRSAAGWAPHGCRAPSGAAKATSRPIGRTVAVDVSRSCSWASCAIWFRICANGDVCSARSGIVTARGSPPPFVCAHRPGGVVRSRRDVLRAPTAHQSRWHPRRLAALWRSADSPPALRIR